jgi:alkanesulfonate monooxygenase SsuD/methylene tetrahydromethanopterin reductase-like flavin-dependent oxidoreductase (luciferase family)
MKFGAAAAPNASDWQLFKEVEELGFDSAWIPDSQMIWTDCFALLALVAQATSRIQIGTGVAIAATRIAPVTAHAIATINQLAPGRTFLGIGSGHTAMRAMGLNPMKGQAFREYLRVVRALLHGEEVSYQHDGVTRDIRFLHEDQGYINTEQPVRMIVGADGPVALSAAGQYGDGRISGLDPTTDRLRICLESIAASAAASGRELPEDFTAAALAPTCILQPGEKVDSDRVVDQVGATAVGHLHMWYELYLATGDDAVVPEPCRDIWERYLRMIDGWNLPIEKVHQRLHLGHATYLVAEERELITPELIEQSGALVGEPEAIIHRIKEQEAAGLTELVLLPALSEARTVYREFADAIIERY